MTGIECELDIPLPTQLPSASGFLANTPPLVLATHEALTNILKHSGGTPRQDFNGPPGNSLFEITIADDGKGFNAPAIESKSESPATMPGDGLINMRRRLADIGGQCRLNPRPGKGQTSGS